MVDGGQHNPGMETHLQTGNGLFDSDPKGALAAFYQVVTLEPTHIEGWNQIGRLMFDMQQYSEAEMVFKRVEALATQQDLPDWAEMAAENVELAQQTAAEQVPEAEAEEVEEAVELSSTAADNTIETIVQPVESEESKSIEDISNIAAVAEPPETEDEALALLSGLDVTPDIAEQAEVEVKLGADPLDALNLSEPVEDLAISTALPDADAIEQISEEQSFPDRAVPVLPEVEITPPAPATSLMPEAPLMAAVPAPEIAQLDAVVMPEQAASPEHNGLGEVSAPVEQQAPIAPLVQEMPSVPVMPQTQQPPAFSAPPPMQPSGGQAQIQPQPQPQNQAPTPFAPAAVNSPPPLPDAAPFSPQMATTAPVAKPSNGHPLNSMLASAQTGQMPSGQIQGGHMPARPDTGLLVPVNTPAPPPGMNVAVEEPKSGTGKVALMITGIVGALGIGIGTAQYFELTPSSGTATSSSVPVVKNKASIARLQVDGAPAAVGQPTAQSAPASTGPDRAFKIGMGHLVKKEYDKARTYLQQAATAGHAEAGYNLASLYATGKGGEQDFNKAVRYLEKSSRSGYYPAMTNLGLLYAQGQGVEQDYLKARDLWLKAAEGEHADAMHNLAVIYATGKGVDKDMGEAVKWYRKGANAGYVDSIANLGLIYANGNGVDRDYTEAKRLWEKAASKGHKIAAQNLEKLKQVMAQ